MGMIVQIDAPPISLKILIWQVQWMAIKFNKDEIFFFWGLNIFTDGMGVGYKNTVKWNADHFDHFSTSK